MCLAYRNIHNVIRPAGPIPTHQRLVSPTSLTLPLMSDLLRLEREGLVLRLRKRQRRQQHLQRSVEGGGPFSPFYGRRGEPVGERAEQEGGGAVYGLSVLCISMGKMGCGCREERDVVDG
jgi:hypothetical protein